MDPLHDHDDAALSDHVRFATMLDYDFMKQAATISLAALGGIVTFAGSIFEDVVDKSVLWGSAGLFAAAAVASFQAQDNIVRRVRLGRKVDWRFRAWRVIAVSGIGMGTGALLAFAYEALS
ncbi:MAG: hypothetical protein Q7J32_04440 [Sphingomonadaceae bacterium]|nr:hypothetical protein [Sphingomonadaceae bacterium]